MGKGKCIWDPVFTRKMSKDKGTKGNNTIYLKYRGVRGRGNKINVLVIQ